MQRRLSFLVLAVIAVAAALWWSVRSSGGDAVDARPAAPERVGAAAFEEHRAEREFVRAAAEDGLDEAQESAAEPSEPRSTASGSTRIRGRALGLDGSPSLGVGIGLLDGAGAQPLAWSSTDGSFVLDGIAEGTSLGAVDAEHATLLASRVLATNSASEHVVVVAPARDVVGRVVDAETSAGLSGARVWLELPPSGTSRIAQALDTTYAIERSIESDADGGFELAKLARVPGAALVAESDGYASARVVADADWPAHALIRLTRAEARPPTLHGTVVHADGRAAAGARVQLDAVRAAADASGAFELRFEPGEIHASAPLVASLPSFWPAIEADWGARLARGEQLSPVRLVLGGASLSIRGRVVDAGGGALAGWEVAVVDATALTPNSFPIEYVEDLAGDGAGRATTSGADGGFELRGLAARAYTLHALDRATLVKVVAEEVPAGSDGVVLRVAADARLERVAGRVVGADGGAIANVRVGVRMNVESAEGARVDWVGAQAVTDEQGRFELASVPRRFAEIALGGDAIVPVRHSVDRLDLAGELVLRAARRCHFRVRVASDSAATSFRLEALDGSEERIEKHQASSWSSFDRLRLVDGVSDVVSAAEGAHVLVLQRGGVEIARRRIELIPGDVAEIGL